MCLITDPSGAQGLPVFMGLFPSPNIHASPLSRNSVWRLHLLVSIVTHKLLEHLASQVSATTTRTDRTQSPTTRRQGTALDARTVPRAQTASSANQVALDPPSIRAAKVSQQSSQGRPSTAHKRESAPSGLLLSSWCPQYPLAGWQSPGTELVSRNRGDATTLRGVVMMYSLRLLVSLLWLLLLTLTPLMNVITMRYKHAPIKREREKNLVSAKVVSSISRIKRGGKSFLKNQ